MTATVLHRSVLLTLLVAAAAAFAIWALSPWITGYQEPWDGPGSYYFFALLCAGAVSGFATAKPLWAHYVGSLFGQLLYGFLFLPIGPLAAVGLLFLVVWSVTFLVGAYIALLVRTRLMGR